jgi:hypothetical protein
MRRFVCTIPKDPPRVGLYRRNRIAVAIIDAPNEDEVHKLLLVHTDKPDAIVDIGGAAENGITGAGIVAMIAHDVTLDDVATVLALAHLALREKQPGPARMVRLVWPPRPTGPIGHTPPCAECGAYGDCRCALEAR